MKEPLVTSTDARKVCRWHQARLTRDIAATIYIALGISHDLELNDGQDKLCTPCTGKPIASLVK